MARQQQSQFINQAKLNELTSKLNINHETVQSKPASVLSHTNVSKPTNENNNSNNQNNNNKSSKSSNVGSELKWKSNYSSDSDASFKK